MLRVGTGYKSKIISPSHDAVCGSPLHVSMLTCHFVLPASHDGHIKILLEKVFGSMSVWNNGTLEDLMLLSGPLSNI